MIQISKEEYQRLAGRVDEHGDRLSRVETHTEQHSNDLTTIKEQMSELLQTVRDSRDETAARFKELKNWRASFMGGFSLVSGGVSAGVCGAVFWALGHFFGG